MANALLIGSAATKYWFADARTPKNDLDFFIDYKALNQWVETCPLIRHVESIYDDVVQVVLRTGQTFDFDNSRYVSVQRFMALNADGPTFEIYGISYKIASPESLLAIKKSHVNYRHNWRKHIADYTYLKSKKLQLNDALNEALQARLQEREARGDFKTPGSLDKTNDEFFAASESGVRRKFVHDDLHKAVAYGTEPLYTKAKHDQSKALLDQELFSKFSKEDQCRLVREETYVIGLERIIIPMWYNQYLLQQNGLIDEIALEPNSAATAYEYALMRICTDLTKGWFREFATEHYAQLAKPDCDYIGKFMAAFAAGTLKFKD